ncbi:Protein pat-12 [Caenorhabditis elegans]|uniref:Isoform d of Protein pat-12 n=1 Tax=Caenorhabditis elegans TaxID=6239 RepID=Q95QA6-4|nr:Protein pat-12 [Caenorhabditis elegans]CCD65370.1 Protein pat-12 [Caenorhabditis elegans]|eukprot:NP_497247.2 Protein pat-12 [Caenorhabditis elegans]
MSFQQPQASPISPGDSGWLIKMRKNRYLDHTSKVNEPKKYRSMDQLPTGKVGAPDNEKSEGTDPLHWQLRKDFHLAKYSERRASYHVESSSYIHSSQQIQHPPQQHHPPPPSPPPVAETIQHQPHPSQQQPSTTTISSRQLYKSQLLYPPGSTENIASEHKPAIRPPEKSVYENNPIAPSELNVQVKRAPPQGPPPPPPPQAPADIDYPERLMSPPPTHQPRSILKGYSSQQYYSQTNLTESHHHQSSQETSLNPQQMHPRPSDRRTPTHFEDLSEDEKTRIMHENLQRHRNMRSGPNGPRPTTTSFNGPFFRLEQVNPGQNQPQQPQYQQHPRSQSVDPSGDMNGGPRPIHQNFSASEIELHHYSRNAEPSVVVWPPVSEKERERPSSVLAKNFNDPERIDEYQRQKRLEYEAIQRTNEKQAVSMAKQVNAMMQQQKLYERSHGMTSPVPIMESISPQPQVSHHHHQPQQHQQHQPQQQYYPSPPPPPQPYRDPEPVFNPVQVYETRPISALSDQIDQPPSQQAPTSWKRTYIVERPRDVAKNEIITSDQLLEKEAYDVDLLKRRETFVEKPEEAPRINRLGRRWQPPPERPYVWPTLRRAMSVEPSSMPVDFAPGVPHNYDDNEEYKWEPVVNDPGYKKEDKNFTPVNSPPASPRRGHGVGPLDEPARRQAKYVIQPSPDGSHRPKAVFRKERHAPSGGFYPHAPNAIKVVKKRAQSVQGLLSPTDNVEVIHQRNYHRLDLEQNGHHGQKLRRSQHGGSEMDLRRSTQEMPDWEKIYELPPHSSQIVQKDMPRHVDVQRRLSKFEGSIQNLRAATSTQHLDSMQQLHFPMPDYEPPQPPQQRRRTESSGYRGGPPPPPPMPQQQPREMSRRNSVASTRIDSPSLMIPHHRQSRSDSRGPPQMSRAASSIPLSPQPTPQHHHHHHSQRPTTPGATRARNYIARATAPSPTPYSYDRARAYVPPALPPGYRLADPIPDQRAMSPSPGHTRKLIRNVSESAQRLHPSGSTPQTSRAPSRHSHRQSPNPRFL